MKIIHNLDEWQQISGESAPPGPVTGVLVGPPDHFDIVDVRNEHMKDQVGNVRHDLAWDQWKRFCQSIIQLGLKVHQIEVEPDQVDAVFTANPSLSTSDRRGNPRIILGRMNHPNRIPETEFHLKAYTELGLQCDELPSTITTWEGNGDTLRDLTRPLLWCGLGPRSEFAGHIAAAEILDLDLALLELPDPRYYHLDTALAILNESTIAIVADAFNSEGLELLNGAFENLIEVDPQEAQHRLAGNMWSPDGSHVLISSQTPVTSANLKAHGFRVIETETDEFLKSGGSVFCMRQEIRDAR